MRETELPLIAQPAKRGARVIALHRLRAADRTYVKAVNGDPEGLHAFRVALRQTRTVLRVYRSWLAESVSRKSERRLRRMTRASNRARDYEVCAVVADRLGLRDVTDRLFACDHQRALLKFRKAATAKFPQLARRLKRDLSEYSVKVKPAARDDWPFGAASAQIVQTLSQELRAALASIVVIEQQEEAHEARITAKRLRYTLEPFRRDVAACKSAVDALKSLQTNLGDLHDYHVLSVELKRRIPHKLEGLAAEDVTRAADTVAAAHAESFERALTTYLGTAANGIADLLEAAAVELLSRSRGDVEIERKYLLRSMPTVRGAQRLDIIQGYLPGARIHERVRAVRSIEGKKYYRTIKTGIGMVRTEIEEEIDEALFRMLWRLTRGRRIRKRRYVVTTDGGVWTVDKFKDRELFLAEIELDDEKMKIEPPAWLRPFIVADVTEEANYSNYALAK